MKELKDLSAPQSTNKTTAQHFTFAGDLKALDIQQKHVNSCDPKRQSEGKTK